MTNKEIIFEKYCEFFAICCNPVSCPGLLRVKNWLAAKGELPSLYMIRRVSRELVADGLIERDGFGWREPDWETPKYCSGYVLTKKGKETDTYKRIVIDVGKAFDEMWKKEEEKLLKEGW